MISLCKTPKRYDIELDKICPPADTIQRIKARLQKLPIAILGKMSRIDTNVLGIPVFLSTYGQDVQHLVPSSRQMGKGASAEQAEASALMELMERFAFFTFWDNPDMVQKATWFEAEKLFSGQLISPALINQACFDSLSQEDLSILMGLRSWLFAPALHIASGKTYYTPLDLFKILNEYNGASAGNSDVESILQGTCELIERHVCALIARNKLIRPTIDCHDSNITNTTLRELIHKFHENKITLILKDFSLDMPIPTVAALAMNPSTFPEQSEIVFTAGSATTPEKAAIRALTELAQLAGDFCTCSHYESSGLPKFCSWSETTWLQAGNVTALNSLPRIEHPDMLDELLDLANQLEKKGFPLFSVSTFNTSTQVPSHYSFIPGFHFYERDANPSLGLFICRKIVEEAQKAHAEDSLQTVEEIYPDAHFIPFFKGLLAFQHDTHIQARQYFAHALPLQPDKISKAIVHFYTACSFTQEKRWHEAIPHLSASLSADDKLKEAYNLRGVCYYKLGHYSQAAKDFQYIITTLDKSSVMDLFNLGLCSIKLGQREQAISFLDTALALDPGFAAANDQLITLLAQSGSLAPDI